MYFILLMSEKKVAKREIYDNDQYSVYNVHVQVHVSINALSHAYCLKVHVRVLTFHL